MALETFRLGFAATWVEGVGSWVDYAKTFEDARHTMFQSTCVFCILHAVVLSNLAVWQTRRSKAKYPSSSPALVTWFCGFCPTTLALIFAGGLVLVSIPVAEVCHFTRYDLLTYDGVADYYTQLGLVDRLSPTQAPDQLAVDLWRTCMTPNGTGDALGALQLRQKLEFQRVLHDAFVTLEDKMAGAVIDVAKFELLVSQATRFGGLFVLDPDEPKALDPNSASKMMGSSLEPDDIEGPEGESLIYGLNTFASAIAGPGRYSFEHGTTGGGTLITAMTPTDEETSGLLMVQQNAMYYARLKEQILSEPRVFRCDVLDAQLRVTEVLCSYEEFKTSVLDYAKQVRVAAEAVGTQALSARQLIASDLQSSLRQLLAEAKALRELFGCRFLWKRWEAFDLALCNRALPGMLQGAAAWMVNACFMLFVVTVHYKIWRHLLDNRIVGEELERFSKKYGYLSVKH